MSFPKTQAATGWSVLVVEDEAFIRCLIAETFILEGYEVTECRTADEAFEKLKSSYIPDVLVTAVDLPGKASGIDLARRVRKTCPAAVIALCSGSGDVDADCQDFFLVKPFSIDSFISVIESRKKSA